MDDEEEIELCRRYRQGDQEALVALLAVYEPLLRQLARSFAWWRTSGQAEDFASVGKCGLLRAFKQFDLNNGHKLRPYAKKCILNEILNSDDYSHGIPRLQRTRWRKICRAHDELMQKLGRRPTEQEIAERIDLTLKQVTDAFNAWMHGNPAQFPEENLSLFASNDAHPEDRLINAIETQRTLRRIERALASKEFAEDQRDILGLYYFGDLEDHEIAEKLGFTEAMVKQRRTRALRKLHDKLMADEDSDHGH